MIGTIEERFWSKVNKDGPIPQHQPHLGKCWLWMNYRFPNGYGGFDRTGAHRASWIIAFGKIPEGLIVCHKCDTKPCVNPSHLFLGTPLDNATDRTEKGRTASGARSGRYTKPERTARGERHADAKLTEAQILQIREMRKEGSLLIELSNKFGVSIQNIWRITKLKIWKHV